MRTDVAKKRRPFGDLVIYLVLVAACVLLFVLPTLQNAKTNDLTAEVIADSTVIETIDLSALDSPVQRSVNGCEITFFADGVRFDSADCPDKCCVKTGTIKTAGDSIACVPNRVVVTLKRAAHNDAYDVVAY